ncbi:13934_t:CDS:1 [Funneliformis caledonium]|uniref:13934_t:CDS:1 n=1 Tax=Funneliformis caledonium TaxID=1117310 RepID=A0A9N9G2V5_9GLOM|nr:13934_t:CDS:1 [Funneliformis caledonium]
MLIDIDDRNLTHSNCTEIKLGSKWNKHKIESAGFISTNLENNGLLESIMRVYSSYFSWEQALLKTKVNYYQSVSYSIVEPNGNYQHVKLCVGKAVETTLSADSQSAFGIIKGIIEYTWNDDQVYVFIYLDWLEDLKKRDNLLDCPIYHLQHTCNNSWDQIHPISIVSKSPNVPFIHYCKAGCSSQRHDTINREYI